MRWHRSRMSIDRRRNPMVALSTPIPNDDQAPAKPPIAEEPLSKVRPYIERLLGWDRAADVDRALESIDAWLDGKAQLSLVGHHDMVPVGEAIQRRTLGQAPFIVLDSRRLVPDGDFRSPPSRRTVADA